MLAFASGMPESCSASRAAATAASAGAAVQHGWCVWVGRVLQLAPANAASGARDRQANGGRGRMAARRTGRAGPSAIGATDAPQNRAAFVAQRAA